MRRDCRSCGVLYPRLPASTFSSMDLPAPLGPTTATEPVPPHKDTTAWLGKSDSNSEMLSQSTLLKSRADFLRFSWNIATRDHSRLSYGVGDTHRATPLPPPSIGLLRDRN